LSNNIFGIVCEFNPFHNGHAHLIAQARALGASHIVLAMSGNFVQRGEPAIYDDRHRAAAALHAGADLAIKIPVCHCLSSAQFYASSAVYLLSQAGCTHLIFGSESGDIAALQASADIVSSPDFAAEFRRLTDLGESYARARAQALQNLGGDQSHLQSPNNILALEYLSACKKFGLTPITIPRLGVDHDGLAASGNIASATAIRQMIQDGDLAQAIRFVPCGDTNIAHTEIDPKRIDRTLLAAVAMADKEQLSAIPFADTGLGNALKNNLGGCTDVSDLIQKCANNRITHARVRRALWCLYLGITKDDIISLPAYLYVIGGSAAGTALLKHASLPVVTSLASIKDTRFASLEAKATDAYGLCKNSLPFMGEEYRKKFVII